MSKAWPSERGWDRAVARFELPSELRQPTPRRVTPRHEESASCRARAEFGCMFGCASSCAVPAFLLGVWLVFCAGLAALSFPLGSTTMGVVTEREPANRDRSSAYLRFRFDANQRSYESEGQVRDESWRAARVGAPIQVRYFSFAPGLRPLLAADFSPWRTIFGAGLLGLLIMALCSIPYLVLVPGHLEKRLVRSGIATAALIMPGDKGANRFAVFVRDEKGRFHELKEGPYTFSSYRAGQVITALYLPGKIERARLYHDLEWKGRLRS